MSDRPELVNRLKEYAHRRNLAVKRQLGSGVHGIVFQANSKSIITHFGRRAIKIHEHEADFCRERDVYFRLDDHEVRNIRGCAVPALVEYDDELWALEMTVVTRPFILDFAGAYLDQSPGFSEEVLADWECEKREQFAEKWQGDPARTGRVRHF